MKKIFLFSAIILATIISKAQVYGPFYGASANVYKSNLFNSDDLRADSFQTYKMTMGFGGGFDFGYLYQTGFSVQSGLHFGTVNQNYEGSNNYYSYGLKATTKTSYLKIPIVFGIQNISDRKFRMLYTIGFYYSMNTGYSDEAVYTDTMSILGVHPTRTTIVKDNEVVSTANTNTTVTRYALDKNPYQKHGLGATGSIGFRYNLKEKMDLVVALKSDFTLTNAERTEAIKMTPVNNPNEFPKDGHIYQNYAKYMTDTKKNWNRASTHPFTLGLNIGLRFYLFDF